MADPAAPGSSSADPPVTSICPWCSAALPVADVAVCPSCEAHLVEDADVALPGVTAVDPALLAAAAAPHKVTRTFGALLVRSDDDEIPPPTEAEMPALARPDLEVRREMLRLELEARLTALRAEAAAMEAEEGRAHEPPAENVTSSEPGPPAET